MRFCAKKKHDNHIIDPDTPSAARVVYDYFGGHKKLPAISHETWGVRKQNTVFAIVTSILKRDSATNIGELCLACVGGGHMNAGTCQIENNDADRVLAEIIEIITTDG